MDRVARRGVIRAAGHPYLRSLSPFVGAASEKKCRSWRGGHRRLWACALPTLLRNAPRKDFPGAQPPVLSLEGYDGSGFPLPFSGAHARTPPQRSLTLPTRTAGGASCWNLCRSLYPSPVGNRSRTLVFMRISAIVF